MKQLLFLFFSISCSSLYSQRIDNPWIMGYDCCSGNFSAMDLDFSSGNLTVSGVQRSMNFSRTNAQISNTNGEILFTSNGVYVADANNQMMLNGNNLNPSNYTTSNSTYGLTISQANIVIPFPMDTSKYYLFHLTIDNDSLNLSYFLYYSVIDMALNGGLGSVVQKNTVLLNDTLYPGKLTACKHANGRDWWLISQQVGHGNLLEFLITPSGISGPFIQNVGSYLYAGQSVFTPAGDKFAMYDPYVYGVNIWDFDRCSGDFINHIQVPLYDTAYSSGVAFSPSGRYLYVSSMKYMYQFDIQASNIAASKVLIGTYDGFISFAPTTFYLAQLAPDNKIYITCGSSIKYLHVINYPDSAGLACDFCQHCVSLPGYNGSTLPNHPNYYLGALQGSVCDSLFNDVHAINTAVNLLNVFPNPAHGKIYITQNKRHSILEVEVYNSIGQKQPVNFTSINNSEYMEGDVSSLISGLYFVEIRTSAERVVKKVMVE